MADSAKREKIAAAKKKLKQFQQKTGGKPKVDKPKIKLNGTASEELSSGQSTPSQHNSRSHSNHSNVANNNKHDSPSTTNDTAQKILENSHNSLSTNIENNLSGSNSSLSASSERLQQLSVQINGLITRSDNHIQDSNGSDSDLQLKYHELAGLLKKHDQFNTQLNQQLEDLKAKNARMQAEYSTKLKSAEDAHRRDLTSKNEQLQVHIQTIGILVAEKTELQSNVNQSTKLAKQQHEDIDELKGRLKASRQRVADLEKNYTSASSSSHKNEQTLQDYSKNIDSLKLKVHKLNKSNDEFRQQTSELQEKLQLKVKECYSAEDNVIELKGQLELAQLQLTQMQNSSSTPAPSEDVAELVQQKNTLEGKLQQYEESFQKVSSERDQITEQYNNYITQLNEQTQMLKTQVTNLEKDRTELEAKHSKLIEETALLQQNQESVSVDTVALRAEKSRLTDELEQLHTELESLQEKVQTHVLDNSNLSQLVHEKENKIDDLEMTLKRVSDNVVDKEKILDDMQSDKTALSRAMAQNKELKNQLAELQNGFVALSNDKMEIMSKLQSEEHISSELATRLEQQEDDIKDVRHQLAEKEITISELETSAHEMHKEHYTALNMEDRLRHFEAQSTLVDTLQRELTSTQDTINALTNQNSALQSRLSEGLTNASSQGSNDELVNALNSSINQLEMERNQVLDNLSQEKAIRQEIEAKMQEMQQELAHQTPAVLNGDLINKVQFDALQYAMKQLENKYTHSMREKADLTDKCEQLEYLIVQLQGETETIGEYISLYRQQRHILKEKQDQRDDYVSNMAKDKEYMQDKLGQLQALVMQLLGERNMLHAYGEQVQSALPSPLANHISPSNTAVQKLQRRALSGSTDKLEDWPDYSSGSDSDSERSEVEAIIGGPDSLDDSSSSATPSHPGAPTLQGAHGTPEASYMLDPPRHSPAYDAPEDHTAQQIMSLLNELGTSNIVEESTQLEYSVFRCNNCIGRPHIV